MAKWLLTTKKADFQKIGEQFHIHPVTARIIRNRDLIEEEDGILRTYEFKWSGKSKAKQPLLFASTYPDSPFTIVSPDNYWEFVK